MDVLRSDLIERARKMTRARSNNHSWLSMDDVELLRSAGLRKKRRRVCRKRQGQICMRSAPQVSYTTADLNWMDKKSRSSVEMNDPASRPVLADMSAGIGGYDVIFVGYPNWLTTI